jgi:alpha-beta hydrolase superfamily lysophospholipase
MEFGSGSLTLVGDLLIPHGNPPFPAVILIEGSTTQGRGNWTYRSFGEFLARNGIAAFIYDKRGVGESDGELGTATFDDLASDAAEAVRAVAARPNIDSRAIGLLGISQGGWLAPMAAQKCDSVSFLILVVGAATSVWNQELHRVAYTMRAGSLNEDQPDSFSIDEIADALEHTRLGFSVASNPERWGEWSESVTHAKAARWSAYVALDSSIEELQGWLRQHYDPAETLRRTTQPVLAMFGENDTYVPPRENVDRMRALLQEAGNRDVTLVVYPDCGHELIRNATLVGNEWDWPKGFWQWARRAPGVADSLVLWTLRKAGR